MRKPHLIISALLLLGAVSFMANSSTLTASAAAKAVCVQDDKASCIKISFGPSRRGKASYTFRDCCLGIVLIGTARVDESGAVATYTAPGITFVVDQANKTASGSVLYLNSGPTSISDSNTGDSICACL